MKINEDFDLLSFREAWKSPKDGETDFGKDGGVFSTPFKHLILPDFVKDSELLSTLKEELMALEFHEKNNDLYKFRQSSDLKGIKTGAISAFKELIYTDFRKWLIDVTGLDLKPTVDVSCAQYSSTDVLLCHDDELEGRRIAFIFYLVDEGWSEKDGGTLDLFSSDEYGQPDQIAKRIVPRRNNLALFEVTPVSHHQVAEVMSDKVRLSISGWFYGESLPRQPLRPETPRMLEKPVITETEDYFDWINPAYMNPESQGDIQEHFEGHSEIQLQDFLNKDLHKALFDSVYESSEASWKDVGPPHKRSYGIVEKSTDVLERARDFFSSELMLLLLSNMTGLKLHPLAPDASDSESEEEDADTEEVESGAAGSSKRTAKERKSGKKKPRLSPEPESEEAPEAFVEWRRFQHGSYTLLHDAESSKSEHSLMLIYYLCKEEWDQDWGGYTSFIAKGENEELLTVTPKNNCLALVYCCPATLSFLKHINNRSRDNKFFSLNGFYTEIGGRREAEVENFESDVSEGSEE